MVHEVYYQAGWLFKLENDSYKKLMIDPKSINVYSGAQFVTDIQIAQWNAASAADNFKTWHIATDSGYTWGSTDVVASGSDTMDIVPGSNIALVTDNVAKAIRVSVTGITSFPGFGTDHVTAAYGDHTHSGTYEPAITKAQGYLTWTGAAWSFINETYSLSTHNHSGTYEPAITKSTGYLKWTGTDWSFVNETYSLSSHNHDSTYLAFKTINVPADSGFSWGSSDVVADLYNDTLKLVAGTSITIETDATNDAIRISSSAPNYWTRVAPTISPSTANDRIKATTDNGYAIWGSNSSSGANTAGIFGDCQDTFPIEGRRTAASANTSAGVLKLRRQCSGGGQAGLGGHISWSLFNSAQTDTSDAAKFGAVFTDPTGGAEDVKFEWYLMSGGSSALKMSLNDTADLVVYGKITAGNAYSLPSSAGTQGQVLRMKTPVGDNVMEWYTPSASGDTFSTWHYAADSGYSWGTSDVVAAGADTMDLVAGTNVTIQTDATLKAIKISATAGSSDTFKTWHTGADSGYSWGSSDVVASGADTMDIIPGSNITISTDATQKALKVAVTGITSFPGFGTDHSTAAYGDHTHSGMVTAVTDGAFDLNISTNTLSFAPYAAKKGADPGYAYFYSEAVSPSFVNRLNLDGSFYATSIVASTTSAGVVGISGISQDFYGVSGTSVNSNAIVGTSTNAYGIFGISTDSYGVVGSSTSGLAFEGRITPTSTNTMVPVISVYRNTSGAAASGIGGSISFAIAQSGGGVLGGVGEIGVVLTNVGVGTEVSKFVWKLTNSGASAVKMELLSSGKLALSTYGTGTHTGTPAYSLQVDSSGNVIEGSLTGTADTFKTWHLATDSGYSWGASDIVASGADTMDIVAGTNIAIVTDATAKAIRITASHPDITAGSNIAVSNSNGTVLQSLSVTLDGDGHVTATSSSSIDLDSRYYSFRTINFPADSGFSWGSSDVVADLYNDTLKIVAGTGIAIVSDAANDAFRITCTTSVPVKATGAEIDTGTDDAKFATPKAIADSKLSYTDGTETLTNKRINQRESTTTSSATPTPDVSACDIYTVTAQAEDATWGAPTGTPVQGQKLILRMKCDTSSHNIAFNAIYRGIGVSLPTTLAASKTQYIGCIYNSTDVKWDVVAVATEA